MQQYLIISDIHGSASALKQVLSAAGVENFSAIVLLGDLLNHGARNHLPEGYAPPEVVAQLNPLADKIMAVRGNCDGEVDGMLFNFPCNGPYLYLQEEYMHGRRVLVTHGHLYNIKSATDCLKLGLRPGDFVLSGHTHKAGVFRQDSGIINVNPGSISLPRGGAEPSYAVLNDQGFKIITLSGKILDQVGFTEEQAAD